MIFVNANSAQVTYSSEAGRGYIYFCEPHTSNITGTAELFENSNIMIDLDRKVPIYGIELEGETASNIKQIAGKIHIFTKEQTVDGQMYYRFRLNNKAIKRTVSYPKAKTILFHFADKRGIELIGIDIFDTKSYSEQYLTGN